MAIALATLKRRPEALQTYQQAQQIYESLTLDFRVKQCQSAIAQLQRRSRFPWWGWFLVGVAIVVAIAWWLKG
jgi:type VI protein secretion system component VasF